MLKFSAHCFKLNSHGKSPTVLFVISLDIGKKKLFDIYRLKLGKERRYNGCNFIFQVFSHIPIHITNADTVVASAVRRSLCFNFLPLGTLPLPNGTYNLVLGNETSSEEGDKAHDL